MSDTERDVEKGEEVPDTQEEEKVEEKAKEAEESDEKPPVVDEKLEENEVKAKLLDDDDVDEKGTEADAVYTKDGPQADPEAVEVKLSPTVQRQGLGKEELMQQCNTPAWKATRIALLVLFWLAWFGMLVAVIVLIATAPRCPRNKEWYQSGLSYQIYPRSFKDSGDDGYGDLKGIESKIDYLKSIGVNSIWLGQIFPTMMADMGRDVTNFTGIDEDFYTADADKEFKSLVEKVHVAGMRLVMEFIPNHSSDQHPWFNKSRESRDNQYSEYYIWADGPPDMPPSNWVSRFGESAWTYEPRREQWYLHTFSKNEPDLNFRNENVTKEISNAMEYWLKKKVDGFYLPYANQLIESLNTQMNEADNMYYQRHPNDTATPYGSFLHNNTRDQPETIDLLATWRKLLDGYSGPDSDDYKVLIAGAQSSSISAQMNYYGSKKKKAADYPYNFQLMDLCTNQNKTGQQVSALVKSWLNAVGAIGPDRITNWALGDAEHSRLATRCGADLVKGMNTLLMTLPGSPTTYYGDEIGMNDLEVTPEDGPDTITYSVNPNKNVNNSMVTQGNFTREHFVSPMQWTDGVLAGFSNDTAEGTWLDINSNYEKVNVAYEKNYTTSPLSKFMELQSIRREPSLIGGQLKELLVSEEVYSFTRIFDRWPGYLVAINLGDIHTLRPFNIDNSLPEYGTITYSTHDTYKAGETVKFSGLQLAAFEAVIVRYEQ